MPRRGAAVGCFAEGVKTARGGGFVMGGGAAAAPVGQLDGGGRGGSGFRAEKTSCAKGPAAMKAGEGAWCTSPGGLVAARRGGSGAVEH